ncbi:TfpX/TfpZ family type IV pilin accessory protein [Acinetobacter piscicola]|uniref:TfpX/TfpZ family type IV pilin accessory protein n=1 Tax=Acinetobacter piscicola TaxID=2006115 RepID=UPI001021B8B5|nr:TfpX/TfpZ family type IV pilin accessory protein [Acinetobacter piscicola]RYL29486.1 type IV pilin accessory protein [Acinetobacter piscicola]
MLSPVLKDKLCASAIHLLFSAILVLLSSIVVFGLLYPIPLAQATGVAALFILMLAVDMVLGPALTFIVYKKHKKTLKMDLTVIILIQLSALFYGMYSMYQGRPVWIAYTADRFELVRANDVVGENTEYPLPILKPHYIYIEMQAKTSKEQFNRMWTELQSNISPAQQPQYYRPFTQAKFAIQTKAQTLDTLTDYNAKSQVEKVLARYPEATAWLPLKANAQDMVVLVNQQQGTVIKIVNLRPWR